MSFDYYCYDYDDCCDDGDYENDLVSDDDDPGVECLTAAERNPSMLRGR